MVSPTLTQSRQNGGSRSADLPRTLAEEAPQDDEDSDREDEGLDQVPHIG